MAKIDSLNHLRTEIMLLKLKKTDEELFLNQKFLKISKAFTSPISFIKGGLELMGVKGNKENKSTTTHADWVTNFGRIAIPFLLNKTVLRGRGMFLKTAISLLSQTTINSKNLNKNVLSHWIDKATYWINVSKHSAKKKAAEKDNDYGIPPESETYSGKPVH